MLHKLTFQLPVMTRKAQGYQDELQRQRQRNNALAADNGEAVVEETSLQLRPVAFLDFFGAPGASHV